METSSAIERIRGNRVTVTFEGDIANAIARSVRCGRSWSAALLVAGFILASPVLALTSQKITFGTLGNKTYGSAPFAVSANASSGLPVSFASLTAGVCTASGSTVTLVSAGTCTIRASQPGDATYAPAPDVDQSFAVIAQNMVTQFLYDAAGNLTEVQRVPIQ